ncbi:MAG TPA: FAD-linked oxidase C-terminal domain-containing protein [Streptosporangiaceae bacterium]
MPDSDLLSALRRAGIGDASDSPLQRAAYSSDASLYRVVPAAVVRPRDSDEVAGMLEICRTAGVPVTCRGAGTSIAGNAIGPGVVLDFSRHMNRVLTVDAPAGQATVQPGVVHAQLQRVVSPRGLQFGPDPSTHTRCTIGGMIGNNACGSRALAYGRTSDNVLALEVLTAAGQRLRLEGRQRDDEPPLAALRDVTGAGLATIRTEFGRFGRQGSGYALEHLLPERGFDVRRALVGSEGTLAVVVAATVRLVERPEHRALVVLGYPTMADAADAAPAVVQFGPTACEGLDSRIVGRARARRGDSAVPRLPRGDGWLFVELAAESQSAAVASAAQVARASGAVDSLLVSEAAHAAALWLIREDGAGLAGRTQAGEPAYPGWEDSAVPPDALGAYLRDLELLLADYHLTGLPYGHFGDGCVHLRLNFPLDRPDGRAVLRAFAVDAARLVARYGGSLSGEHGDGRARSELLPLMYSPAAIDLFALVKRVFDPDNLLNPGVLVQPRPVDGDVRARPAWPRRESLALKYRHDRGDFSAAVHRCTGVGKCRADSTASGGVMCPSYLATRDEKDSTRGRARILQEMANGSLVTGGWRAPEVHAALDLCLSCKACSSECPAGVDMASYKSEVLYQSYRRRIRPRSHYALGQLPRWARMASLAPGLANSVLRVPPLARAARCCAGIDSRRGLPRFATRSFRDWFRAHAPQRQPDGEPVLMFVDTFTNYFTPDVGIAAVHVLEDAGFRVSITDAPNCCALTWISTGQLGAARRILRRTVAALRPAVEAGIPILGLEPSCTATLRTDSVELLGTQAAGAVAGATRTLGETLTSARHWQPPDLRGIEVIAQPHCHHSAVMGWDTDAALLLRAGADLSRLGGCCGLAGNFGVERGHYEVSAAVAEHALLPTVRSAGPGAVILADGFSCRTQLLDLAGQPSIHLAQLLAAPSQ